jgi:hypothetical protein
MLDLLKILSSKFVNSSRTIHVVLIFFCTLLFVLHFSDKFFFWDTITEVSVPANFYFDTDFHLSFFSHQNATGHPTLIPLYLAAVWKIFGRSLFVSHLALFPFVFGTVYLLYRYVSKSAIGNSTLFFVFFLTILDPTLLAQASMITFDIPQIFFFLLCIISCVEKKNFLLLLAFTGLCLINLRGIICGTGIIIYYFSDAYFLKRKIKSTDLLLFVPGLVSFLAVLFVFLGHKHWTIREFVLSQWTGLSEFTSFGRFLKNTLILSWRLVDYGRVGAFSIFVYLIYKVMKNKSLYDDFFKQTFLITISQMIVFFPLTIVFTKYIGHRYFLPIFIPLTICAGYWILKYSGYPRILFSVTGGLLISGYFWVYPENIAQGWDATPAHWPYYEVRTKMLSYIKDESIPYTEIGSFFPNLGSFKNTDLSLDSTSFKEADPGSDKFILFSNIFNLPDTDISVLKNRYIWEIRHEIKKKNIYMILFKRRDRDIRE